jgi:hypothetical protein
MRRSSDTVRSALLAASTLLCLLQPGTAAWADSTTLRIKGRLTNAKGAQLTGVAPLVFRIVDADGLELWRDARVVVADSGEFYADLGATGNPLPLPGEIQSDWRLRAEPPKFTGWKVAELTLDPRRTQLRQLLAQFEARDLRAREALDDPHPQLLGLLGMTGSRSARPASSGRAEEPYDVYIEQEAVSRNPPPLAALAPVERERLLRLERVLRSENELLRERLTRLAVDYQRRLPAGLPPRLIRIGVAVSAR